MKISAQSTDKGVLLEIDNREYNLIFPKEIWNGMPEELKKNFVDNFAYLKSIHLPQMLNNGDHINFSTEYPLFRNKMYNAMLKHIPFCSDVDGVSTQKNVQKFMNLMCSFSGHETQYPKYDKELDKKAIISISFGKDSLLTYAVAKEIGLNPQLVISFDNDCPVENSYKEILADRFSGEFGVKIWKIKNNTCDIHRYRYWGMPKTEWGFGHLMTEYCMNMIPFANHLSAKYLLFGNENDCNKYYINGEGYRSYPVYDQTSEWMLELSKITKGMTNNQLKVASIIEPLNELAIVKILHKRYPEIGKYQMSCFPDETEFGKKNKWCGHCSKCARIFIFLLAHGIDPKIVGFKDDMLNKNYLGFYSLFGVKKRKDESMGWDISGLGKDEQLYAFYLAYKNGAKGDLINEFKKYFLKEAISREDELHKRFLGINDFRTIPSDLVEPVLKIYKEELNG